MGSVANLDQIPIFGETHQVTNFEREVISRCWRDALLSAVPCVRAAVGLDSPSSMVPF
jgi:hypothetical protein